jgi:hypothetical protein
MVNHLFMSPTGGSFDVAAIRGYLDAQPDTFADPHDTEFYVVGGMPEAVQSLWEERKQDATRFPCAVLIEVTPEQVTLVQEFANQYNLRSALEFARWMWNRGHLILRDSHGRDVTENARVEGIDALYPNWLKCTPMPWADRLIKVGFFRELAHGDTSGASLEDSRANTPSPSEERVAGYLDVGHRYMTSSTLVNDWLADDPDIEIGPAHILTDGTHAWPADLSYYLRHYHVQLPRHFILHIQRNDYQIPPDVDVACLKLDPKGA